MQVTTREIDSVLVIALDGELVHQAAPAFLRTARHLLATVSPPLMAVDLSQVRHVDSSGFGALVSLLRDAERRRGRLCLVGPRPEVQILLEIMQLHLLFEVCGNVPEACEALAPVDRAPSPVVTRIRREPLRTDGHLLEGGTGS
jgi:anti-sigma B factor antagonist